MRWNILNTKGTNTGDLHDDGIQSKGPGTEGFTRDAIDAHLATLTKGYSADYAGPSDAPAKP